MIVPDFLIPSYILALFDEAGDDGAPDDGGGADDAGDPAGVGAGNPKPARVSTTRRDNSGRFQTADPDVIRDLTTAEQRIAQLNESDKKRRIENKALTAQLTSLQSTVELSQRAAIRGEVRAALQAEGVIDPDITTLFLGHAGDRIKVDPSTGEVIGIAEALAAYKAAKPKFFAAAAATDPPANDPPAGDPPADDPPPKPNSTARGTTPAGGANGSSGNTGGLPDLKTLEPKARKAAMDAYMQSLRR